MRIKKGAAIAGLCVPLLMFATAGAASAGEVKGPPRDGFATGELNPVAGWIANSECAFSGLNAYHPGKDAVFPAVQSYGALVKMGLKDVLPSPGDACNGHKSPAKGGLG
jgi:hypothetical protein